jgi:choline kinase
MKALILNSGTGSRMGELARNMPKCLIELKKNETILGRQLGILQKCGIKNIIITTGPFEDKIKNYVSGNFPELIVTYINNPKFNDTNYIYSLYLTKDLIDDDFILMHGDMVFDETILKDLLDSEDKNMAPVNKEIPVPEKDFKARIHEGIIKEIGVDIFDENCFFLAPIYKISNESFLQWFAHIEKFINEGKVKVYAENAFNEISEKIRLYPFYYHNVLCMEVDNIADLNAARAELC